MDTPQIVVCGSIAIDRIMNFSGRYRDLIKPDKLHVLSLSTLLDKLEDSPGGVAANITSNLAQLGERPILVGSVGGDAKDYIEKLASLGIDTSHVHYSTLPTASFNVITDSEDSQVGGFYPGAMSDSSSLDLSFVQAKDALIVVAAHDPGSMNQQVTECQSRGLRLVYDPGQQVSDDATDLQAGIAAAEVLFANDYEQSVLCEKANITPEKLKKQLPVLVTTLGKQGSLIEGSSARQSLHIGIAKPEKVVDPTGAGDAYRAGFLFGYLRQWDLKQCGQLGAVVASFIVEHHGTQRSFSKAAVMQRYQRTFKEEVTL